jgi:hypothetical protein
MTMGYINPLLKLPAAQKILLLPDSPEKRLLEQLLRELRDEADALAEKNWLRRKPPMAAYWRACATYCIHTARAFGRMTRAMEHAVALATGKALPADLPRLPAPVKSEIEQVTNEPHERGLAIDNVGKLLTTKETTP